MPRKKSTPASKKAIFAPMSATPVALGVKKAQMLLRDDEPEEAYELLDELNAKYPENDQVLQELENAALALSMVANAIFIRRDLVRLHPTSLAGREKLGQLYATAHCPALTIQEWRSTIAQFPDSPGIPKLRESLAKLETTMEPIFADMGMAGEEGFADACGHEEVRLLLEGGRYSQAREIVLDLLTRRPDFAPAQNNLAQAYYLEGNFDGAVATTQAILEKDPENIHALSNLTRYLFLAGREVEAREMAERLKASKESAASRTHKIMEPLTFLGDDAGILEAFRGEYPEIAANIAAKRAPKLTPKSEDDVIAWHFAATAFARTGEEDAANYLWLAVLEVASPIYMIAGANAMMLDRPLGERPAPFFNVSRDWLSGALRQSLDTLLKALVDRDRIAESADEMMDLDDEEVEQRYETADYTVKAARSAVVENHPELVALFPHLLDRSEPDIAPLLFMLPGTLEVPEMFEALRDYGLGQHGTDAERMHAVQVAVNRGLLEPGNIRFFRKGEWGEVRFYGFDITGELDIQSHSQEVQDLFMQGQEAIESDEFEEGERIYREALKLEPDASDLMNNLAFALTIQGRAEEADALFDEVLEKYPDDALARSHVALRKARDEDPAGARELVEPLLERRKFNIDEFNVLCQALVETALADDKKEEARSWINIWLESGVADENDPNLLDLMFRSIDIDEVIRQKGMGRRTKQNKKSSKRRGTR